MKLRDYQQAVVDDIRQAWANGAQNVLAQLSCGAGKTVIFSHIMAEETGYSIAIAHRVELVSQISLTLARHGIRHNILAQRGAIREIVSIHMAEVHCSYYDPCARTTVAGVDTLIRMAPESWFNLVKLVVQDEGHHPLRINKWGKAAEMFPNARGLYPTATPVRADGRGLGRDADGIIDAMVVGIPMRELIDSGYLSDYRIFAPPSDLDVKDITIGASGDYVQSALRSAARKSHITGDVVDHYLRIAPGKLGVTFAVDIENAVEIAAEFRRRDIPAEVISSKTPDLLRSHLMKRFRNREILQLVNVDILGEGVDVPAIEVVSMARPTASFGLYVQQMCRALRPKPGGEKAIIIDHVSNVMRHGLPDAYREWSLGRRERRSRLTNVDSLRTCLNVECLAVYPSTTRTCPNCGFYSPPARRDAPEFVDGDLFELDSEALAQLRGEIFDIDKAPRIPQHLDSIAKRGIANQHAKRKAAQISLRQWIALWAGVYKQQGDSDAQIYKKFYKLFGTDIASAQALGTKKAEELRDIVQSRTNEMYKSIIALT